MEISAVKNLKNTIEKYISPAYTKFSSFKSILSGINLKGILLERNPQCDVLQKQNYSQLLAGIKNDSQKTLLAQSFLDSNPMNKEVYAKLSPEELVSLRAQLEPDLVENAKVLTDTSKIVKKLFDKKYGKNQYTFVSIGRSLSALANSLEFMGVETKHIPFSVSGPLEKDEIVDYIINNKDLDIYKNFLEEYLKQNPKKRNLFCDFAVSGETIDIFKNVLTHKDVQIASKKDKFIKLNEFLDKKAGSKEEFKNIVSKFINKLYYECFDDYAEISSLYFGSIGQINSALKPTNSKQNKLMKFCMLDSQAFSV